MKHISSVLPRTVLEKYIEMYEGQDKWLQKDKEHFTDVFGIWMTNILHTSMTNRPDDIPISLNKKNFLGKKTRALLAVLETKEPKTLTQLKKIFIDRYSHLNNIS